ncbi:MAG: hypothetical protein RR279_02040 [Alistipes sp.]
MKDLKQIQDNLYRLSALIDEWMTMGEIVPIERDLALDELRQIYETLRFSECGKADHNHPASPIKQATELPITKMPMAESEAKPTEEPEAALEEKPEAALEEKPEAVLEEEPVEEPVEETIIDLDEMVSMELIDLAPSAEEEPWAEPVTASTQQPEPPKETATVLPEVKIQPTVTSASKTATDADHSLFDLGELTVHRSGSRRVLMSLYDDDQSASERPIPAKPAEKEATPSTAEEQVQPMQDTHNEEVKATKTHPVTPVETETVATPAPVVLGEVINQAVQTLGETLQPKQELPTEDTNSQPITDLRSALGINDKFLLIKELFEDDQVAFEETITQLNQFEDLDDCLIYIAENFAWNSNSDGAKLLIELLERKLTQK